MNIVLATSQKFHEAFGEPDHTLGKDEHWSLMPQNKGSSINILLNCNQQEPIVCVFNPHADESVSCTRIKDERDIDSIIRRIKDALKSA